MKNTVQVIEYFLFAVTFLSNEVISFHWGAVDPLWSLKHTNTMIVSHPNRFTFIRDGKNSYVDEKILISNTGLYMSSNSGATGSRPKKSVLDRTQVEAIDLVSDVIQTIVQAGPRAGPARSIQAYVALLTTIQEFSPVQLRGKQAQKFSAAKALRKIFERLGATYVKLGQFIASSPTLFPAEYVTEFQRCLDQTEPIEWSVIKKVIESEVGPISKVYEYIDESPLASASIAQVHCARLKNGEEVVIKVQKPGIDNLLKADLGFIYIASRLLEFLQPDFERTSLSAIAGDIKSSMLEELDFEKEARNIEEFRYFLSDNDLQKVATAPKVYREFTTKKILTMERLRGVSMLDEESISKITENPESTIITALNVWTTSVMKMPWFHADVHAGNLLVLDDGRVGFIDFGIVGRVSEKTFAAVNELSTALSLSDYNGMATALSNMGATDEEVDVEKFGRDLEKLMVKMTQVQPEVTLSENADGMINGSIGFEDNDISRLLLDMVAVTEDNGLRLPREFGLLVKQSLYFDRYLKILAPGLDVVGDSRVELGGKTENMMEGVESVVIDV